MPDQTQAAPGAAAQTIDAPSLLDQVILATRPQDDKEKDRAKWTPTAEIPAHA